MPNFPLTFRTINYSTPSGQTIEAKRAYVLCQFQGVRLAFDAFVDIAAPFCVVPYTISKQIAWTLIASSLAIGGTSATSHLLWQGIPCDLGEAVLQIIDTTTMIRSSELHILAKFPRAAGPPVFERSVVIGLNLIDQHPAQLVLEHTSGVLTGFLTVP